MTIHLDHTIVPARDRDGSARFLSEILGLPSPQTVGPFAIVRIGDTSLDFVAAEDDIHPQHYAFLVSEAEFDAIFRRIRDRGLPYWADPGRRDEDRINRWDGGRGVYWDDPNGHLLEIITRPYGSGGTTTDTPHPLVADD
ncbi:VOC family protein [Oceanibacterium hippocampi]|uniref:Glutathione transferase FosA n=1 Tax=Oceanibacterium hippocampi TaxID=745714 RepID=A0A1Y5TLX6_9PROT|nr:VOC family protein [Oceanibacterium hippocampi]SLN65032.1 Glutathione transferase FosA [Oceanibacterium hippocampi]